MKQLAIEKRSDGVHGDTPLLRMDGIVTLEYPREMFARLLADPEFASLPNEARETWLRLVDTVFFASLMLEEGEHVPVVVVHGDEGCSALAELTDSRTSEWGPEGPPAAWRTVKIQSREFSPRELVKLARGLKYGHHVVVVAGRAGAMRIDGIAQRVSGTDGGAVTLIAAPRPGALVFEEARRELLRFEDGEQRSIALDVLDEAGPVREGVRRIVEAGTGGVRLDSAAFSLQELLAVMRSTRSGGMLVMTPDDPDSDTLDQTKYRFEDPMLLAKALAASSKALFRVIAAAPIAESLALDEVEDYEEAQAQREAASHLVTEMVNTLGTLSSIDGALLFGPGFAVHGAGFIIKSTETTAPPAVLMASDVAGTDLRPFHRNVGARHSAAFAFANEHPKAVVFVVSEDGPVRAVMKATDGNKVVIWPVRVPET